jgi:hypothetical protein
MTAAEPFDCHVCHKHIGKTRVHYETLHPPHVVICGRCRWPDKFSVSRRIHAELFGDCPHGPEHSVWDHSFSSGTRAGTRWFYAAPARAPAGLWRRVTPSMSGLPTRRTRQHLHARND